MAIENLENHFIFIFYKNISLFGEISPMENRLLARRALSLSLSFSRRRSSAAADGRTSCLQRTRSALSSPFITRYRWSHIMFSTDTIGFRIAVHHLLLMVAHYVFNGRDRHLQPWTSITRTGLCQSQVRIALCFSG